MYTPAFTYQGMTPGHSLNKMVAEPAIVKGLKAYCALHKCHPISVEAVAYDFTRVNGTAKTAYNVVIAVEEGKGEMTVDKWFKANPLQWLFGFPVGEHDYREV